MFPSVLAGRQRHLRRQDQRPIIAGRIDAFQAVKLAQLTCIADCDASGLVDIDDFLCFQTKFGMGEISADCDLNGTLDIDDFLCFQMAYSGGCP